MHVVVLTGAGISAESGVSTFRDAGGLWEGHDIMKVASVQGWKENPELVLDFYNKRRRQLLTVKPNRAHLSLVELEKKHHVSIITQNVDNLHETAGSKNILHLHGELLKAKSSINNNYIITQTNDIKLGDLCPKGGQLRPNIVWFGEAVPNFEKAITIVQKADVLLIIGTSLQVYPAASLIDYVKTNTKIYYIDQNPAAYPSSKDIIIRNGKATEQVPIIVRELLDIII